MGVRYNRLPYSRVRTTDRLIGCRHTGPLRSNRVVYDIRRPMAVHTFTAPRTSRDVQRTYGD